MRFKDAAHIDLGSFYARRPDWGRVYRLFGYGACVAVLFFAATPGNRLPIGPFVLDPGRLLILLLVAWFMAWKREVGALWRSSLVAAMVMCALLLTCSQMGWHLAGPAPVAAAPTSAPAADPGPQQRPIRFVIDSPDKEPSP